MLDEQAVPKNQGGHAGEAVDGLVHRVAVVGKMGEVEVGQVKGRLAIARESPMTSCHPMSPWRLLDDDLQVVVVDFHSGKEPSHTGQVCEGHASCVEAVAAGQDCDLDALARNEEEVHVLARSADGPGGASLVARRLFCSCRQVAWDRNRRT